MMTYKELFECGENYYQYLGRGTGLEIQEVNKATCLFNDQLKLANEMIDRLLLIEKPVYLLVAAEMWCPFCQLQLSALNKMCELNSNIKMSVITKGRGEDEIQSRLELDEVLIPVVVILDNDFEYINHFAECPQGKCPEYNYEKIKADTEGGGYLNRTVSGFIDMIK